MVDQPPFRRDAVAAPVYVAWGAVIAGAIGASALTFVLITFGAAIGLAIASPSATWRDTSVALALLSGLWLLLTAVASFALGGYLAGRLSHAGVGYDARRGPSGGQQCPRADRCDSRAIARIRA
jgi:hypothetical protein